MSLGAQEAGVEGAARTDGWTRPRAAGGVVVSAGAIAAVTWWGLHQQRPTFPSTPARILLLVGGVCCYAVATAARGLRWHVILQRAGIEHRRSDALALTPVGYMGNNVLPARAGEVLRVLLLKGRSTARRREILGSIVAERLLDALTLALLFTLVVAAGVGSLPSGWTVSAAMLGALAAGVAGVALLLRLRRRGRLERFAELIRPVAAASRLLVGRVGVELAGLTACLWLLEGLIFWLVGRSLSLHLGYPECVFLNVLASLFAMVPAAPGYLGTFDAAIIFGLSEAGVKGGIALSFAILVRFVLFVPVTFAGLVLVLVRYGGVRRLFRRANPV